MTKPKLPHTLNTLIWQLAECKCSVYSPFSFCLKVSICTRKGTPFSPPCFRGVNSVLIQCTWQNKGCAHHWRQLEAVQIWILGFAWTWGFGSFWETKRGRIVHIFSFLFLRTKQLEQQAAQKETGHQENHPLTQVNHTYRLKTDSWCLGRETLMKEESKQN